MMKEKIQEVIAMVQEEKAILEARTQSDDEMHNYYMGQLLQVEATIGHLNYLLSQAE